MSRNQQEESKAVHPDQQQIAPPTDAEINLNNHLRKFKIVPQPEEYVRDRYKYLNGFIDLTKRPNENYFHSVNTIDQLLSLILCESDILTLHRRKVSGQLGQEEIQCCISTKLCAVLKLAKTFNLTGEQLLSLTDENTVCNILMMIFCDPTSVDQLESLLNCSPEFSRTSLQHKVWYCFIVEKHKLQLHKPFRDVLIDQDYYQPNLKLKNFFDKNEVITNFYFTLSEISFSSAPDQRDKHIKMCLEFFGISLQTIKDRYQDPTKPFQVNCMEQLMFKLGYPRKEILDELVAENIHKDQLSERRYDRLNEASKYLQANFFGQFEDNLLKIDGNGSKVKQALEFLTEKFSVNKKRQELSLTFLEILSRFSEKYLDRKISVTQRNSNLFALTRFVILLLVEYKIFQVKEKEQNSLDDPEELRKAMTVKVIEICSNAAQHADMAKTAIYGLNLILSRTGLNRILINYKLLAQITALVLNVKEQTRDAEVKGFCRKIFEYYFSADRFNFDYYKELDSYQDIQFICIQKFADDEMIGRHVKHVRNHFYSDNPQSQSIRYFLTKAIRGVADNDDLVLVYNLRYLLEVLESKYHKQTHETLTRSPLLIELLGSTMLEITKNRDFNKSSQITNLIARIKGAIGSKMFEIWQKSVETSTNGVSSDKLTAELILNSDNCYGVAKILYNLLDKKSDLESISKQKSLFLLRYIYSKPLEPDLLAKLMQDHLNKDKQTQVKDLPKEIDNKSLATLAFFLIGQIEDLNFQDVFRALVPILVQSADTQGQKAIHLLLPYITYFALRYTNTKKQMQPNEEPFSKKTRVYLNSILFQGKLEQKQAVIRIQDFLFFCKREQGQRKADQQAPQVHRKRDKQCVEIMNVLKEATSHYTLEAAKILGDEKRALFYYEQDALGNEAPHNIQYWDLVQRDGYKKSLKISQQLAPEDFKQSQSFDTGSSGLKFDWIREGVLTQEQVQKYLQYAKTRLENTDIDWLNLESKDQISDFKENLALIFAQLYQAKSHFLKHSNQSDSEYELYMSETKKANRLIEILQNELVFNCRKQSGEYQLQSLLFIQVLYELQSAFIWTKDLFNEHIRPIRLTLQSGKRTLKEIYAVLSPNLFNPSFKELLLYFEHQSYGVKISGDFAELLLEVRKLVFRLYDRSQESDFFVLKLVQHFRKSPGERENRLRSRYLAMLVENKSECIYEIEKAYSDNSFTYLAKSFPAIVDKVLKLNGLQAYTPPNVLLKAEFLVLHSKAETSLTQPENLEKAFLDLYAFVSSNMSGQKMQKQFYMFAKLLERLINLTGISEFGRGNFQIATIEAYKSCLVEGDKYLQECLPRALDLMFNKDIHKDLKNIKREKSRELLENLKSYQVASVVQVLLSHMSTKNNQDLVQCQLFRVFEEYPHQIYWLFLHKENELLKVYYHDKNESLYQWRKLIDKLREQARKKWIEKENTQFHTKLSDSLVNAAKDSLLVMPTLENLTPVIPPLKAQKIHLVLPIVQTNLRLEEFQEQILEQYGNGEYKLVDRSRRPAYRKNPVTIKAVEHEALVFGSKDQPQKVVFIGTDNKKYSFLLKMDAINDFTKEQKIVYFAGVVNNILQQDPEACSRDLQLRVNTIVPLDKNSGLIQFFDNTETVMNIILNEYNLVGVDPRTLFVEQEQLEQEWPRLRNLPPVLSSWYEKNFPTPAQRYLSRQNLTKSAALWAIFGYVIGLGDRHYSNMLIDKATGELIHIDFDCTFENGKKLRVSEKVPFRHTLNLAHAYGLHAERGTFRKCAEILLKALRRNKNLFMSYVNCFNREQLVFLDAKLKPMDPMTITQEIEHRIRGLNTLEPHEIPRSVEEEVQKLISLAKEEDRLREMFCNWMAYL